MSAPRVRTPRQQRSRDSLERVITAGIDVLAAEGWEGFTIARVAAAADASVGLIYGRFHNKDALFEAIHDRFMSQVVALHAERFDVASWRSLPTEDVIRLGVDAMAAGFAYNATVLRVSMLRSAVDTTIKARGSRAIDDLAGRFEAALLERRGDFAHAQPELGVAVCFRLVFATLSRRIMFGPLSEGSAEPEWDDLVRELGSACVGLLMHPS